MQLRVLIRCWRQWFTAMVIFSTTTPNCKRPWFGYIFTPTFQNSTRWNAGAHWGMHTVGPRKRWRRKKVLEARKGWRFHSHAKKNASVAFLQWRWTQFSGLKKFPITITNLVMGLSHNKIYKQTKASCHSYRVNAKISMTFPCIIETFKYRFHVNKDTRVCNFFILLSFSSAEN